MPEIDTRQFGTITYTSDRVVHFAAGLPGFEECRDFLLHEEPTMAPFVFLQSLDDSNLSFVTLPVERIVENYELTLSRDDLAQLDAPSLPPPDDVVCLAVLQLQSGGATANLAAPIVIRPAARRGTQAIRQDRRYSTTHGVNWTGARSAEGGA